MEKNNTVFQISYSERSFSDVRKIEAYLLQLFSEKELDRLHRLLIGFENVVKHYPTIFQLTSKLPIRRAVLSKQLSVFYMLDNDEVFVLSIQDNRCDLSDWM